MTPPVTPTPPSRLAGGAVAILAADMLEPSGHGLRGKVLTNPNVDLTLAL
ncbi:hypothetical protein GWK18_08985 [Kocuria sp. JC486]|uniref:Uncharacterized protein n=1 Tax=Kocuria subflava TaxID=1736139 RepID=A0A846TYY8_9MICC|nr:MULTISPECIES: hypothetical protein [Kocuria]NHU85720.1 hypothetical protein [Kocuria sp. JC486]NKE10932.1 hypothetical protein [Kocuria subflava]